MASVLTTSSNTFDPNKDIPDLSGRVYLVTGGSAGIGFGISAHILQHKPAKLLLLGNKEQHLQEAQDELKKYGDTSKVELVQCNLRDLKQTDQVARKLAKDLDRLDALICNAGEGVGPYSETVDGLDSHMQVNVISQHHLARVLLPKLESTPDSRLCFQSSSLHAGPGTDKVKFESVAELNTDIGAAHLYDRSKLAQVLLNRAFHRRKLQGKLGLRAGQAPWINATHPGAVSTDQQEQAVDAYGTLGKIAVAAVRPFMKDPIDAGCRSMLFAATSDAVKQDKIDGQYIVPDRKIEEVSQQGQDEALGERCWKLVESILKDKLGELSYETS